MSSIADDKMPCGIFTEKFCSYPLFHECMYLVSFVDTRYFLAQGFHSRDSIQLTSIFLLFINILLVKTSFLRAAVGTLITRIPCIFNIETKPICSEQCPTWTELTCWWGPDSGWGTMHQIWKKRAILNSFFFFEIFIITLPVEKS